MGEPAADAIGPSRGRHAAVAALVAVLVVVVVASQLFATILSDYPSSGCKGVGLGGPISGDPDDPSGPPLPATPEDAIAELAAGATAPMGGGPVPADGWHEYRGRWVRDVPDGYLEVGLSSTARGWAVTSYSICAT